MPLLLIGTGRPIRDVLVRLGIDFLCIGSGLHWVRVGTS